MPHAGSLIDKSLTSVCLSERLSTSVPMPIDISVSAYEKHVKFAEFTEC